MMSWAVILIIDSFKLLFLHVAVVVAALEEDFWELYKIFMSFFLIKNSEIILALEEQINSFNVYIIVVNACIL